MLSVVLLESVEEFLELQERRKKPKILDKSSEFGVKARSMRKCVAFAFWTLTITIPGWPSNTRPWIGDNRQSETRSVTRLSLVARISDPALDLTVTRCPAQSFCDHTNNP